MMKIYEVSVNYVYEVQQHGMFSSYDLAEEYVDCMVGQDAAPAYKAVDGQMYQPKFKKTDFDIQEWVLDAALTGIPEEDKLEKCGNTYTTADKNITFTCSRDKGHEGYHTQNGGVWGFELPKLTKQGCF